MTAAEPVCTCSRSAIEWPDLPPSCPVHHPKGDTK